MLVILIFTNSLMSDVKAKQQSLVLTMPFTRKEIVLNKLYFGLMAIVSCTLISFVIAIITLYLNHELLSNYIDILILAKWFIISLITNITVFSLSILVELVIGNRTLSFIVSMIMVFYPAGFCFMLGTLISRSYSEQIFDIGSVIIPSALSNSKIIDNQHFIDNYGMKIIILLILSVIFILLALYAFKKLRIEKSSRFVMFKPMENFFMCGFSISLWVPFIFILSSSSIIPSSNILALKIIALIFAITIGIFSSKAMFKYIK
ncbi:ABC-2 transporter permease [Abyssisolibacter fermentans]|uniref:ABC-2 transporter permease n=1 Tax=Abyssisolibacter fermentans TaxID=1766203 RepID=UPI000831F08F|nr:ABC-2 transporter permease [Abyssisolibacter fermentans]